MLGVGKRRIARFLEQAQGADGSPSFFGAVIVKGRFCD